jgi:hypothetical protein
VHEIFESKPEGSRRGRPRLRWIEDVEKDLRETKVKRWRQKLVNRKEWASVITEAKALRGPYRRGVSSSRPPTDIVDIERTFVHMLIAVSMVFRESVTAMCSYVPPLPTYPAALPNCTVLVPP